MNSAYFFLLLSLNVMTSEHAIIDTRPKIHKEGCEICQNIAKERCQTGGKGDALCHKIAHESCPSKILKSRPRDLPPLSGEDPEEVLEIVQASPQQKDDKGVFDLVNGILMAVHTSTKADLRRAKEKELKDAIFRKVAAFR